MTHRVIIPLNKWMDELDTHSPLITGESRRLLAWTICEVIPCEQADLLDQYLLKLPSDHPWHQTDSRPWLNPEIYLAKRFTIPYT